MVDSSEAQEMSDKAYVIRFKHPHLTTQPALAASAEIHAENIALLDSKRKLAALFLTEGGRELFRVAPTAPNTVYRKKHAWRRRGSGITLRQSCRRCFEQLRDRTIFTPGLWLSLFRCTGYSRGDG
jgi:hypothetical protein